ncbi:hypothetical protein C6N01_14745, partial [Enterococcus faecalis]|uniref:hypothetical protein n=1 Tax=Enterococcus faecalis TaxID=1351 RepID=UPI0013639D89
LASFAVSAMTINMAMVPLSALAEESKVSEDTDSSVNILEKNVDLPKTTMDSETNSEDDSSYHEDKVEENVVETSESTSDEKEVTEKKELESETKSGTLTGSYENDGTWTFDQENGILVLSGGTLSASIGTDSWLKEIKKEDILEIRVVDAVGATDLSSLFN